MEGNVSALRSEVIEKSINLEWMMCVLISQHYFGRVEISFLSEFLYDEYCSFALKRRVLLKIRPEMKGRIENDLGRLNTIRNYFAHCGQQVAPGPDPNGPSFVPDPRDFSKPIDFRELHAEFMALEGTVLGELFKAYEKLGGVAVTKMT